MASQKVVLLVERINEYNGLFRDREYAAAYEMLGSRWREGEEDKQESIRAGRKMDNSIKILDWRVKKIWIAGDRAKVRMAITGKNRESLFRWKESTEEEDDFWIFENNNWYYIPLKVGDWDDSQAVEVPVPRPRLKVEIKKK
jgi:inorganic triphosphatase YgiF